MLKEGRTKYNEPKIEEVEKRNVLAEALGNPEHRGHVRGVSLRQS